MHVMCENNERYDYKTVRWKKKKKTTTIMLCVWILNTNDVWKQNLFKNLKTENFLVSIDRALIEYQSSHAGAKLEKYGNFWLIKNHTRSIEILENWIFWKIVEILCRKHSKCMSMSLKVFQKHLFSTQNFQKQDYDIFLLPNFNPKNIFCIKNIEHVKL